jgi:hypothetical protein
LQSPPSAPSPTPRAPSSEPTSSSKKPPSPAQIGLWAKTLGGIEPLLDLLRRLIQAGLANKREPRAYIHRVVLERAAHPEPVPAPAWQPRSGRSHNPILAAGVDDIRREQARRIMAGEKRAV